MNLFLAYIIPAVISAVTAYLWARYHKSTAWLLLLIIVVIYGPIAAIIIIHGLLLRWEMLLDHVVGVLLLGVIAAVAFVTGQKEGNR